MGRTHKTIEPTLSRKQQKAKDQAEAAKGGGLIRVSFTFDDKTHVQTHRLTQSEMDGQKALLRQHGPSAFSTATLQVSIWGAGQLGKHCVTEAFKDYARKHYREEEDVNRPTAQEVVDVLKLNMNKELGDETTK